MDTPRTSSEIEVDAELKDLKLRAKLRRDNRFKDQFHLAAIVFMWVILVGFIVGGAVLMVDAFLHDKVRFNQLALAGVSFVAGVFAPRIAKILDDN